jgi:ABC-type cobalamin/Fe3+-siderophores transport system ATPase subunit
MKVICIVGKKRTGKTTLAAGLIKKLNRPQNFIYDINNEYTRKLGIPNNYRGQIDKEEFLKAVNPNSPKAIKNSCIVFEEATGYFSSKGREEILVNVVTRSRHTNNTVILIFHSIADLPRYIFSYSDYVALFKTNDFSNTLDNKLRKNEQFMKYYEQVKFSDDPHKYIFFENLG